MDYHRYELEDFLVTPEFRDWVLSPDQVSCRFWKEWLETNPSKKGIILEARAMILSIKFSTDNKVDDGDQEKLLSRILTKAP